MGVGETGSGGDWENFNFCVLSDLAVMHKSLRVSNCSTELGRNPPLNGMEKEQSEFPSAVGGGGMLCDWSEALGSHLSSLVALNLHKARIFLS